MNSNTIDKNPTIYLKDYQPPAFFINKTELNFELETQPESAAEDLSQTEVVTIVRSRLSLLRNNSRENSESSLTLHGQSLQLKSIIF